MAKVRAGGRSRRTFVRAAVAACFGLAAQAAGAAGEQAVAMKPVAMKPIVEGVWIGGQISPQQVAELKAKGIRAIVDLRPDGEAPDQPTSDAVAAAARAAGLAFSYAPVSGSEVPAAAVDAVSRVSGQPDGAVLLYCRSGRRAARIWSLAEASRPGGLDATAIEAAAASAGQPVDDLAAQIAARVAKRH